MVIQSPPGWGWDQLRLAVHEIGAAKPEEYWHEGTAADAPPAVRRIDLGDLWNALARGVADFEANRTDVIFLCVIYPVIGLVLGRLASGHGLLPLLFPLASGFALVGPFAAVGLNEISRRREDSSDVRVGSRIRRTPRTVDRLDHVARPDADRAVPALAGGGADHLRRHTRSDAAGLGFELCQ
jgi:hypothetical protein